MPEEKLGVDAVFDHVLRRLDSIEDKLAEVERKSYETDKELSGLKIDIKYIREGLDQTKGGINKLLWGIALVFVTYVVGFVVAGGLNIGGL